MAARIAGLFENCAEQKVNECKLLVVGAGGIGCELLKNLVLTGFENIHVIDLDTIDLSNLNRQFLFHKQHIGKPKAVVAKESVVKYNPKANITAYHDSITNPKYNVEFYRQFTAVANALDNVAARSHVNRMCMAAEIPLIESGSAGYLGQTTVYKRKVTECFECTSRKPQKTYPGCTIRNTPSEPVHCIVWAKHLFNQLFGESDADDEVSPDVASAEAGSENSPPTERFSTREWAISTNYDPKQIFHKLFNEDILYLMKMNDLWVKRKAPRPLKFEDLPDAVPGSSQAKESEIQDLRNWSLKECGDIFIRSLSDLKKRIQENGPDTYLVWDKDDDICLDFVASCCNLRSYCFYIPQNSRFEVKAIAGNIIPAIASTNGTVAGLVVIQLMNVLNGDFSKCRTSYINETYSAHCKLISACQLEKPNPSCFVCSSYKNEVTLKVNVQSFTLKSLEDKILKEKLHVVQPDVVVNNGSGTILLSSDPEEMSEEMYEKSLSAFNLESDSQLLCEDFLQNFKVLLLIKQDNDLKGQEFIIDSDVDNLEMEEDKDKNSEGASNSKDDSECLLEEEPDILVVPHYIEENGLEPPPKKIKIGLN